MFDLMSNVWPLSKVCACNQHKGIKYKCKQTSMHSVCEFDVGWWFNILNQSCPDTSVMTAVNVKPHVQYIYVIRVWSDVDLKIYLVKRSQEMEISFFEGVT